MTLPKDLRTYSRKRFLIRIIPCAILVAAFAAVLILWGKAIFNTDNVAFRVLCYVLVMLIPFALTGVPHKLIDETYCGTVKKVDIVTTMDNESSIKPTREQLYERNTIYLSIEQANGKLIYKKVYSGRASMQQNINKYNEGDFVFHLYGTKNVLVLPDMASTTVHCAVCGSSNKIEDDKCRDCGHSLVKKF